MTFDFGEYCVGFHRSYNGFQVGEWRLLTTGKIGEFGEGGFT